MNSKQFINKIKNAKQGKVIIIDEAGEGLGK